MSEQMPKTIWTVLASCTDPARENEFNEWYNKTHIPDLMQTPGIVRGYRYRNLRPKPREDEPRYLALYWIESDDPWGLLRKVVLEDDPKRAEQGRMIDCIKGHLLSAWELIFSSSSASAQQEGKRLGEGMPTTLLLALTNCTDPTREDEFNGWYNNTHISDLLQTPGIVRAYRYRSLKWKLREGDPKYLALYQVDSEDPWGLLRQVVEEDKRRAKQGRMIDCLNIQFGTVFEHIGP